MRKPKRKIEGSNETSQQKNIKTITAKSNPPKKDDIILYKLNETDNFRKGTILNRPGKQTGKYKNSFNIKLENTEIQCLTLEEVYEWKKADNFKPKLIPKLLE